MTSRSSARISSRFVLIAGSILVAGLIGLAFWPPETEPDPVDAGQLLAQAEAALRDRQYERVLELAGRIPPEADEWSRARMLTAEVATRTGQYQRALDEYDALAARHPGSVEAAEAHFYMGEVHRALGQLGLLL